MRHLAIACATALAAWAVIYGCSVDVTGAPCVTDDNCPAGQFCGAGRLCETGATQNGDGRPEIGDGDAGDGGAGNDGPPTTDDGPDDGGSTGADNPSDAGDPSDPSDTSDGSLPPDGSSDAGDAGCTPEGRLIFCARMRVECGQATGRDNCGADRSEFCGGCVGCMDSCDTGKCVATPHVGTACSADDVYWTDSCGNLEDKKDDCMGLQVCFQEQCCLPATCDSLKVECGTWDNGCGGSVTCPACSSPFKCCKGKCCNVVFVKWDATGAQDGSSWKDAFKTTYEATAVAQPDSEIWVAKGTYVGKAGELEAVKVGQDVKLYGGFEGVEMSFAERNLGPATETIISGGDGVRGVVLPAGATLDGFTVSGAKNVGQGGGVSVIAGPLTASVAIANCAIKGNEATVGGGVYVSDGTLSIDHSAIADNRASDGGGIYNQSGNLKLTNSVISGNRAYGSQGGGGGVMNQHGDSEIASCVFEGNTAEAAYGGALYNVYPTSHAVANSTFALNAAVYGGGAVFNNVQAVFDAVNCIFWGNTPNEVRNFPNSGAVSKVRYSLISPVHVGEGNFEGDPRFADAGKGDFHLLAGSPCIDTADGAAAPPGDIEGTPRNDDLNTPDKGKGLPPYADIGAFEYVCKPVPHAESRCDQGNVYWFDSCGYREDVKEACQSGQVCAEDDCCTPKSEAEICEAEGLACGEHTVRDNCGQDRQVKCGGCENNERCCEGKCFVGDCCGDADCPAVGTTVDGGTSNTWKSTCYQNHCRTICNDIPPKCKSGQTCCTKLNFCVDVQEVCCATENDCLIAALGKCCAGVCDPVGQECR
ncbi:MAG: hypothetical protein HY897_15950 [Deltaproteobacteria bacterium]|nr:hypothetical protein [Deltaproteobacteria bacterium]